MYRNSQYFERFSGRRPGKNNNWFSSLMVWVIWGGQENNQFGDALVLKASICQHCNCKFVLNKFVVALTLRKLLEKKGIESKITTMQGFFKRRKT